MRDPKYGWIPDLPDKRDWKFSAKRSTLESLPSSVSLLDRCPPVYDQSTLGSCTANAIGGAHQFNQIKQYLSTSEIVDISSIVNSINKSFIPSRLFIYYNEREMEGTINSDSGAMLRDGIKSTVDKGVCPESEWPYNISVFKSKPSDPCYEHALLHQSIQYMRINQTLDELKGCLAEGYPFVFGFAVYQSFESKEVASTGMMSMPKPVDRSLGGHAVLCIGYDDAIKRFIVRNSWGTKWGSNGNFFMPYEYMTDNDLAADFWTIRLVEAEENKDDVLIIR